MKTISVIITSYNQKDYLREAVESVLNQTLKPHEIIICDDASSDGSRELVKDYERKYPGLVKGLLQEENIGISKNRNSGIRASEGEFVTWLDGDDRFKPEKLEQELGKFLKHPEIKWVYSQVMLMDAEGNGIRTRYKTLYDGKIFDRVLSMVGAEPNHPLVESEALKKTGLFQEDLEMYEDFDLCLRLARDYSCAYCEEPLAEYRMHPGNIHKSSTEKHMDSLQKVLKNLKKLLASEPKEKRRRLEHDFLYGKCFLLMQRDIEEGRRRGIFLLLCKAMRYTPWTTILNKASYIALLRIILPAGIFNFMRRVKGYKGREHS